MCLLAADKMYTEAKCRQIIKFKNGNRLLTITNTRATTNNQDEARAECCLLVLLRSEYFVVGPDELCKRREKRRQGAHCPQRQAQSFVRWSKAI